MTNYSHLKLSKETEQFILDSAPKHIAKEDSPNNYEDVKKEAEKGIYVVFSGGYEDTIFSSRKVQYAYRAGHDSIHLTFDWGFDRECEIKVACMQQALFDINSTKSRSLDGALLKWDLILHVTHYYHHNEQHPVNQLKMIDDFIKHLEWYKDAKNGYLFSIDPKECYGIASSFIVQHKPY